MKKLLSLLLALSMLLAMSVTASAAEFPDVPAGSTYAQAVQWVSRQGYINGYNDGRFGVGDNVTRAQLAAILYRAAGSPAASGTTRFPDVAQAAYYVNAASWAADGGLINGYSDGRFGVNNPITRQQVTAIFWRWAGSPAASAEDYDDEASISDYAKTAVDWARANSIVPAKNQNRFAPADNATRGEIALILYNYMNRNSQPVAPSAGNGAKVLVAYFSATGSTEAVANTIADTLKADIFEITPANPYSSADLDWTDSSSRVNAEHEDTSKRNIALVKDTVDNWADYDVVFIGYPIWWGIAAWPVDTFVKANDFTGKTVIPFCTSSSSGLGQSGRLLEEMAKGGDWQEGQRFSSGASAGTVTAWVNGLNLPAASAATETVRPSRQEGRTLAASFSESGMEDDWLAAFMMSSILLNPQLILYSMALGNAALAIRMVSSFLCGAAAGLLIRWFYREKDFFNFTGFSAPASRDTDPNVLMRLLKNLGRNIKATGPMFLLGVVLSALFQRYVPSDVVAGLFGDNEGFGVLMAATIGVPLYACGGGTIPLLQAWLIDGMSMGSAAAFMITGPATKITNLGAVKIVLGAKRFALYWAFTILFALATGWLVNLIF